jgi:4-hydroxy-3-methylbut-2-enyl diphosphate reductase
LFIICSLVYIRSGLFDILDIQGDLIVGKETLPILVGEKNTLKLLEGLGAVTLSLLILLSLTGRIPPFGLWLLLPSAYLFLFLILFEKKYALPGGIYFEALVEFTYLLRDVAVVPEPMPP